MTAEKTVERLQRRPIRFNDTVAVSDENDIPFVPALNPAILLLGNMVLQQGDDFIDQDIGLVLTVEGGELFTRPIVQFFGDISWHKFFRINNIKNLITEWRQAAGRR